MAAPARRARWSVVGAALASCVAACTLVSGWSDLQNGGAPRHDGDAGASGPADASGAEPSDASLDVAPIVVDAHDDVDLRVTCGGSHCIVGQGCCLNFGVAAAHCALAADCSLPDTYLACTDSRACTVSLGHSAFCCLPDVIPQSVCKTTCSNGEQIVCDLDDPASCPAGRTCTSSPTGTYATCR